MTINEIAKLSGVSNATVSHVINNTRYVSPEIQEKVWKIIEETGYAEKLQKKNGNKSIGGNGRIAMVVPDITSITYVLLNQEIGSFLENMGYTFCVFFSFENTHREKTLLNSLCADRNIQAIILIPILQESKIYEDAALRKPIICLDRKINNKNIRCVYADNEQAVYRAAKHLIRIGHENIILLMDDSLSSVNSESIQGYKTALSEYGIPLEERYIIRVSRQQNDFLFASKSEPDNFQPTACIATTNRLTKIALRSFQKSQIECPEDISLIGFGDSEWSELYKPSLTQIKHNIKQMTKETVDLLIKSIQGKTGDATDVKIPMDFIVRQSTQAICRGPFGERALPPEVNLLSEAEREELLNKHFTVAISFHDATYLWAHLHEQAIRETLNHYGISVTAVTDAGNDYQLQLAQLDSLIMLKPDALISLPVDEKTTAQKYKELCKKTKLVFLNGMPASLEWQDYAGWISVNDWENGQIAAGILIDHFAGMPDVKIGMLTHGISFKGSHQREFIFEQRIEDTENLSIASRTSFEKTEKAFDACSKMVKTHPEIKGIYVTYSSAAIYAIHALESLGRDDIVVVTHDLDYEIARYMSEGKYIIGVCSQRYYEQGIAIANATAKALLGHTDQKSICVQPYKILPSNLKKAWTEIIRSREPDFLKAT